MQCFVECLLPTTACNLRCDYCYIRQRHDDTLQYIPLDYSVETILKAFKKSRWGGGLYVNLTGYGETFLQKELIPLVHGLLEEGHWVSITTNGTVSKKIEEVLQFDSGLLKHLHIAFSFHYLELVRVHALEIFFDNVRKVRDAGCSFLVQFNLYDGYVPYLKEIEDICIKEVGAKPQVAATRLEVLPQTKFYTTLTNSEYINRGKSFESKLFDFTVKNFNVPRKEFCYAGKWSFNLKMKTGDLYACYGMGRKQNIFKNLSSRIKFEPIGCHCKAGFCFNSSHFLSLGVIPSIETPTYAELRNRPEARWYNAEARSFLGEQFKDSHKQYSPIIRFFINIWGIRFTFAEKWHSAIRLVFRVKDYKRIAKKIIKRLPFFSKLNTVRIFCIEHRENKNLGKLLKKFSKRQGKKILLLMTPEYNNIGDHLIAAAAHAFFTQKLVNYTVDEIPFDMLNPRSKKILSKVATDYDFVVITGGGFLGSLYLLNEKLFRMILKAFPDNKVVVFPQSIYFEKDDMGKKELELSKVAYINHKNLILFIRDTSIAFVKTHFALSAKNIKNVPDIALFLNYSECKTKRTNFLLCFRNDKEKIVSDSEISILIQKLNRCGMFIQHTDTVVSYRVPIENRNNEIEKKVAEFQSAKLVITDRLHGMIFAAITGTPCIAVNNATGKIGGVYDLWLKNIPYIRVVRRLNDVNEELIAFMLGFREQEYNPDMFLPYWKEICDAFD